jgi:hypothetical protein
MNQQRDSQIIRSDLMEALKQQGIRWETIAKLKAELKAAELSEKMKKRGNK